ncbi:MAG: ribonuclease H-like domain-containing protein [Candidatus Eremiobacteraeota bacterium]|nr:ribonuclease H-like domain-containing protein [Candidatus Eremiobacteraeota bacterium]
MSLRSRLDRALGGAAKDHPAQDRPGELRERLERIAGRAVEASRKTGPSHDPGEEALGGEIFAGGQGSFVLVRNTFPESYFHGTLPLGAIRAISPRIVSMLTKESFPCAPGECIFIDTETTGLAGGAGTVAFLVGVGFFSEGAFHLHQYFMRDYHEEKAMLSHLREVLASARGFVSFNGKAYDVPLIEERYVLNRTRTNLRGLPHLDLLYPSRRLFKGLFDDCRLKTLEVKVLGMAPREDDIESFLIPQCYFDFVRSGRTAMMKKILSHNRLDIITLVALTAHIGRLLSDPLASPDAHLAKVGRFHRESGDRCMGTACLEEAVKRGREGESFEAALHLSLHYRREGRLDEAASLWHAMIEEHRSQDPFPFIELAKYYEHRLKDPGRALEVLARLKYQASAHSPRFLKELARRESRLEQKAAAGKSRLNDHF